ncbi:conserved hypothetical protein [Burkholderia cenocepacia HI2424]|uniref:Uncharacterized protein n=2 Tax=Burkholderia cepacia complex TaxID=87882 RepID=A0A427NM58_9BURK|nr:conserved hypothetical protein [Burkholderia cenocepacia HI2424]AQQ24299.1 hypothetical protein A8E88_00755 [Burkholderia cenocepacia]ONV95023.1 hypothetical protein A8E89_09370 [Burkholderia cenocepacia]ONW10396.1 hypothetical protein A8E90_26690 [Burkholderia cenocepacia]ONW23316.1 hypothetical protein A8E94_01385 [Burkholderia cenocepacia]
MPCGADRGGKSAIRRDGSWRESQSTGNVSGTYPYSARDAETRDRRHLASIAECRWKEAGRPSAQGGRRCDQACADGYVEKALQKCDLVPVARDADALSRVTRQGEYRCVRKHLVRRWINT